MKILVINPGGTSTKVAVYEDKMEIFKKSITHTGEDLKQFKSVFEEYGYRKAMIEEALQEAGHTLASFQCVVGRGGLMKAIPGGTYRVNDRMVEDLKNAINGEHASNLGAVIARNIGDEIGVPSFVVDPVSVD